MSCLGVLFALTADEVSKLKSFTNDQDRLNYLQEEIEPAYFSDHRDLMAETDKAWDAIHRALSDGDLSYTTGPEPLRLAVIGGEGLYFKDDYIMSLKTPEQVRALAPELEKITEEELKRRYDGIEPAKYGFPKSEEDRHYTWDWFQGVTTLYKNAAAHGRYVLFTVDQ